MVVRVRSLALPAPCPFCFSMASLVLSSPSSLAFTRWASFWTSLITACGDETQQQQQQQRQRKEGRRQQQSGDVSSSRDSSEGVGEKYAEQLVLAFTESNWFARGA
jgi:hypothetical protein